MLDSDVNNPDARLAVRFYQKELENQYLTTQEGRPISYMADFVRIEVPGDRNTIIDTFVNEDHKRRFPIHWAQYQNDKNDRNESEVQGTLLRNWNLLTPAQASELKHFKFYTVEQIASASDDQIQKIGMLVGMSPYSFRDKAKAYLASAQDSALAQKQAEALNQQSEEIKALKAQLAELASAKRPRKTEEPKEAA